MRAWRRAALCLVAVCVVPAASSLAQPRRFVAGADGGSRIQFVSDAPLETMAGVTTAVSGELTVDPAAPREARGRLTVDLATLRTGIDLRDEHLRGERWLDTQRFPQATFEITGVERVRALRANVATPVRVRGRFTLHGVTRDIVATGRAHWMPLTDEMRAAPGVTGDILMIHAAFALRLADYGISVPTIARLKLASELQINIDLRTMASDGAS